MAMKLRWTRVGSGGRGWAQGLLLHLPQWPSLPAASRVWKASLWVSRHGVGSQGWGSSRAALRVCRLSPCRAGILAENFLSSCSTEPWLPSREAEF